MICTFLFSRLSFSHPFCNRESLFYGKCRERLDVSFSSHSISLANTCPIIQILLAFDSCGTRRIAVRGRHFLSRNSFSQGVSFQTSKGTYACSRVASHERRYRSNSYPQSTNISHYDVHTFLRFDSESGYLQDEDLSLQYQLRGRDLLGYFERPVEPRADHVESSLVDSISDDGSEPSRSARAAYRERVYGGQT